MLLFNLQHADPVVYTSTRYFKANLQPLVLSEQKSSSSSQPTPLFESILSSKLALLHNAHSIEALMQNMEES
jgi:hypothetical protein